MKTMYATPWLAADLHVSPESAFGGSQLGVVSDFDIEEIKKSMPTDLTADKNFEVVYVAMVDYPRLTSKTQCWAIVVCYRKTNPTWSKSARGVSETVTERGYFSGRDYPESWRIVAS